jgi:glycosyltransferase involved in cell wall biosynthesis
MISFTKAEGFGRPLLEFSACNKPILAPHYSGPADFLKKDFICEIKGGLTEIHASAQNDWVIAGAKWFTPDYMYASSMIEDVRKNYKKWKELAKRQRYFVNSTFTKTAVTKIYETVLTDIDTEIKKIPTMATLKLPSMNKIALPKLIK